jgi:glycerophosphoryl diester phosphodiesterase
MNAAWAHDAHAADARVLFRACRFVATGMSAGALTRRLCMMQPIFLQSFEQNNLRELRPLTDLPIVQLLDEAIVRAS